MLVLSNPIQAFQVGQWTFPACKTLLLEVGSPPHFISHSAVITVAYLKLLIPKPALSDANISGRLNHNSRGD